MNRFLVLTATITVCSCAKSPDASAPPAYDPTLAQMPTVAAVAPSADDASSPAVLPGAVSVGANGWVAYATRDGDHPVVIIDTTGAVAAQVGSRGSGPGELNGAMPIALGPTRVTVFDMVQNKLVSYALPSGKLDSETRWGSVVIPAMDVGDRGLLVRTVTASGTVPALMPPRAQTPVMLIAAGDTVLTSMFAAEGDRPVQPTVGVWSDGFVIGHGSSYRLALYNWDGTFVRLLTRDVSPPKAGPRRIEADLRSLTTYRGPAGQRLDDAALAQRRRELETRAMPHFSHVTPLQTDARGRIWVVGAEGDSAFADVFTPTAWLGRISLNCNGFAGRWSLAGEWLALLCDADEASDVEQVVNLYRVVEPAS